MKRDQTEQRIQELKEELRSLRIERTWDISEHCTATASTYSGQLMFDVHFRGVCTRNLTPEDFEALAKYRRAYDQWMKNELDELPPSVDLRKQ